jgi:hypothetical protein
MGMSDKKTKQEETKTSTLNPWSLSGFESDSAGIMDTINSFNAKSPFKPYTGEMVSGLSDSEKRARDLANANVGSGAGAFSDAEGLIKTGAEAQWDPEDVSYRTYNEGDEAKFMNPYKSQVVDATGAFMDEARDKEIMANQARATLGGAFGGSRHGVADGELMRTAAMDKAGVFADLSYKGFNDSMDRYERESGAVYGADTFNAGRNDEATKFNIDNKYRGAGALTDLAKTKQDAWMKDADFLNQLGMSEREIEDTRLLAERAQYDEQAAEEWKRLELELQTRIGLMGSRPMLVNQSGKSTTTTSDPIGQMTSLAGGIGGAFGGLGAFFKPAAGG